MLLFDKGHLIWLRFRIPDVPRRKGKEQGSKGTVEMIQRLDDRIAMELPCRLLFPEVWSGSLDGVTANLHRTGVLVACRLKPGRELPQPGDAAALHIQLPVSSSFPPKFLRCDTTLLRIDRVGDSEIHFAMQIQAMDFEDLSSGKIQMMEFDSSQCRYVM